MKELSISQQNRFWGLIQLRKHGATKEEIENFEKTGILKYENTGSTDFKEKLKEELGFISDNASGWRYYTNIGVEKTLYYITSSLNIYADTLEQNPELYDLVEQTIDKICLDIQDELAGSPEYAEGLAKLREVKNKVVEMKKSKQKTAEPKVEGAKLGDMEDRSLAENSAVPTQVKTQTKGDE